MRIDNLDVGTKLMWDAPLPYEGYNADTLVPGRIVKTMIISEIHPSVPEIGRRVKSTMDGNGQWVGKANQYLRLPTEEELNKYEWPGL